MTKRNQTRKAEEGACVYVACGSSDRTAGQIMGELDRIARICRAKKCRAVLVDGAGEACSFGEAAEAFAESSAYARSESGTLSVAFCTKAPASGNAVLAEIGTADGAVRVAFFEERKAALEWLAMGRP